MNEFAQFLTFSLRDIKAGLDMIKVAINLNPISSDLWSTLGDCLFEFGRVAEARPAYLRARQLNSSDPRPLYNLAWVYAADKDYAAALQSIAEAFALDRTGEYRERLLQKQSEILAQLAQRHQQEALRLANRISSAPRAPTNDKPATIADDKSAPHSGGISEIGPATRKQAENRPPPPSFTESVNPWR